MIELISSKNQWIDYEKEREAISLKKRRIHYEEEVEAQKYPILSPQGDYYIKKLISEKWNSERAKESTED